ncbi:MAG: cyclic nucleotide-binding domain-containing protein [Bacteroidetes bacterium]|nr:cyclic nucleotide-binding domain-containing protein [Bacteroidota bacterium]
MFYHNSAVNLAWNIFITVTASISAILIPIDILFNLKSEIFYNYFHTITTIVFTLDILLNIYMFKTYKRIYLFEDNLTPKKYFQTWFIIDFIAALPLALIFNHSIFQLLRIVKLFKVQHFMKSWKQKGIQYANILSIVFFIFWVTHFAHWISCGWLALKGIDITSDFATNYISSLYWCITTLTTVGYGDITPNNNLQMLYTIFTEILGVGMYGYVIGNVANILSKRDPAKTQYLENLEKLTALLQFRKLPFDLQHRIRDYYTYMWRQRMGYDESDFLKGLPVSLQSEVSLHLKKEVIEKIPLFKDADPNFIREISMHLKPVVLTPGDCVFSEGDTGKEMYFVVKGELEVLNKENKQLAVLKDGDFFGEIAIFANKPRTATVRSLTYCDLYSLNKSTFDYVISKYKEILSQIEKKAKFREDTAII